MVVARVYEHNQHERKHGCRGVACCVHGWVCARVGLALVESAACELSAALRNQVDRWMER